MTKDCPRGLKAFRQKMAKQYVLAASLVITAFGCSENDKVKKAFGLDKFEQPPVVMGKMPATMGAVAAPPAPTPPKSTGPSMLMGEIATPVSNAKPKENCEPGLK